ncbi:internalin [Vibrio ishigakensis]|uniref:Internalin n=1 Tax=Vibrio ishigakensis TaxID=1481914 RepID=A0A0B8PN07_9VIBR|nr:internalin [Vibrio ishigakensis]
MKLQLLGTTLLALFSSAAWSGDFDHRNQTVLTPEIVHFNDPNFEQCIRDELDKPEGPITEEEMASIYEVICNNYGIVDISEISLIADPFTISLNNNLITDVSPLDGMLLNRLDLDGNLISDFSSVTSLPQAYGIEVRDNNFTSLESFSQLVAPDLGELNADSNQITSIDGITHLDLDRVSLSNNNIDDIDSIGDLENLVHLFISFNNITSTVPLSNNSNLMILHMEGNQLTNVEGLGNLPLGELNLSSNQITDISDLTGNTTLSTVVLNNNSISDISALSEIANYADIWIASNNISDFSPLQNNNAGYIYALGQVIDSGTTEVFEPVYLPANGIETENLEVFGPSYFYYDVESQYGVLTSTGNNIQLGYSEFIEEYPGGPDRVQISGAFVIDAVQPE